MKLLADQKGDVSPQAWVTFTGSSVMRIKVREPKLVLKAENQDKVLIGETAAFNLTVNNPGDGSADQVKIHAVLSEGLEHPRGQKIDFDIGNLAACRSATPWPRPTAAFTPRRPPPSASSRRAWTSR